MDDLVSSIAIIPARGGSKRIPKKNIIDMHGKPMLAWTIEAALRSEEFDRVIVSTDDEEIASIAKNYGAEVPFMREGLSDDFTSVSNVTVQVVQQLQNMEGGKYDNVVQLMANCPTRDAQDIREAFSFFREGGHSFQISCFEYGWINPWWAHKIEKNNVAVPVFDDEQRNMRSQDQPELYCPTGAIWIAKSTDLIDAGTFYGANYRFCPMHWKKAVDVDNYKDLEMAETVLRSTQSDQKS